MVARHVLGLARADDGGFVPVIDGGHDAAGQRPLDVAEQDHARLVGLVLGPVNERLVENDRFAVAPVVGLAVDENAALFRIRRRKPEVVAQRSGERVAMLAQITSRRQQREHRCVDRGDRLHQRRRFRAQGHRRGQGIVVPLHIEALPSAPVKGVESEVVVFRGRANVAFVEKLHCFLAHHLPVIGQLFQLREFLDVDVGAVGHGGKEIHQHVVRRHERRVVGELAIKAMPDAPAIVDIHRRRDERVEDEELRRQQIWQVVGHVGGSSAAAIISLAPGGLRCTRKSTHRA